MPAIPVDGSHMFETGVPTACDFSDGSHSSQNDPAPHLRKAKLAMLSRIPAEKILQNWAENFGPIVAKVFLYRESPPLPSKADIRSAMSAFPAPRSALHPTSDLLTEVAVGPLLTQRGL